MKLAQVRWEGRRKRWSEKSKRNVQRTRLYFGPSFDSGPASTPCPRHCSSQRLFARSPRLRAASRLEYLGTKIAGWREYAYVAMEEVTGVELAGSGDWAGIGRPGRRNSGKPWDRCRRPENVNHGVLRSSIMGCKKYHRVSTELIMWCVRMNRLLRQRVEVVGLCGWEVGVIHDE